MVELTTQHKNKKRTVAYVSEDPEFRDKIYEKGKDAYISLGEVSYPDKMAEIYKEAGFSDYDEETKEYKVQGDYKKVKALAQQPLPGLPSGIRGIGYEKYTYTKRKT